MSPASQNRVQCVFAALLAVNLGLTLLLMAGGRTVAAARMPVDVVQSVDVPASPPAATARQMRHITAAWKHGADIHATAE